jgi:hypothetical protein
VRSVSTAAAESGSISPVPGSTSQKTGVAPVCRTPRTEAMNVWAGTITSSPGPMPAAFIAMVRAAVPEATPTHSATPHTAANSTSKRSTSSPRMNALPFTTRSNAAASS